jgi:hypothetical protein
VPLALGSQIGTNASQLWLPINGQVALVASRFCTYFFCYERGYWGDNTPKYLGLRFSIHGEVHYGWARVSFKWKDYRAPVKLEGYAYETTPNHPILAGKKTSFDSTSDLEESDPQAGSLGALARGAARARNRADQSETGQ